MVIQTKEVKDLDINTKIQDTINQIRKLESIKEEYKKIKSKRDLDDFGKYLERLAIPIATRFDDFKVNDPLAMMTPETLSVMTENIMKELNK